MGRGKVNLHASYWVLNSPGSLTNAAIRLVKNDKLQKPVQWSTLCSRSVPQASGRVWLKFRTKRRAENSSEFFTGRKGYFRYDTDRFRQEFYFSAVLHGDRTGEDFRRIASELCDFSYLPVEKPIKQGQSLGLTCASLQDVKNLFGDNLPQLLFASAEKALHNDFKKILKDRSSKVHQQVQLIVVDESHSVEIWTGKRFVSWFLHSVIL